jgi:hypothetical protein
MKKMRTLKSTAMAVTAGLSLNTQASLLTLGAEKVTVVRSSFSIKIPKANNLDLNDNPIDQNLESMLKSYGVTVDQESEISVHEEDSFFDISCINCLIRNHNNENENAMPDNLRDRPKM